VRRKKSPWDQFVPQTGLGGGYPPKRKIKERHSVLTGKVLGKRGGGTPNWVGPEKNVATIKDMTFEHSHMWEQAKGNRAQTPSIFKPPVKKPKNRLSGLGSSAPIIPKQDRSRGGGGGGPSEGNPVE